MQFGIMGIRYYLTPNLTSAALLMGVPRAVTASLSGSTVISGLTATYDFWKIILEFCHWGRKIVPLGFRLNLVFGGLWD